MRELRVDLFVYLVFLVVAAAVVLSLGALFISDYHADLGVISALFSFAGTVIGAIFAYLLKQRRKERLRRLEDLPCLKEDGPGGGREGDDDKRP